MRSRTLLVAVLVVVTACGSDEPAATTTSLAVTTSTTVPAPTTAPDVSETTTTTLAATTTTLDPIDVTIANGEVTGPATFTFDLGDTVSIPVVSDVDDEVHVHGYDLFFDIVAGVPLTIEFLADVPGVFEVEVHTGHTHIFDVEVSG